MNRQNKYTKLYSWVIYASLIFINTLFAITDIPINYYTYKSTEQGKTYLEFFFKIENSQIQFVKNGQSFSSDVEASLYIFNDINILLGQQSYDYKLNCSNFEETNDPSHEHFYKFNFNLNPGTYKAILIIEDANKSERFKKEIEINLPDYWSEIKISSLQISTIPGADNIETIPNIQHVVSYVNPIVDLYYETYNIENAENGNIDVEYRIENEQNSLLYKVAQTVNITCQDPGFKTNFSTKSLPSGNYTLRVINNINDEIIQSLVSFTVIQHPANLKFKSFADALKELQFIASSLEIEDLENAATNDRQKALDAFWEKKDLVPETDNNEIMFEYYKRLNQANDIFTKNGQAGWQTDFGMIYILFGKPDAVYAEEGSFQNEGRTIWQYKKLNLTFTFVSLNKFSRYSLIDKQEVFSRFMPR